MMNACKEGGKGGKRKNEKQGKPSLLADLEATGARDGADAVVRDLGALLDSGAHADVVFRVGEGAGAEEMAAHRLILTARSPYFAAMLAERWSEAAASSSSSSSSSSSDTRCTIDIASTAPAAFKQLLRFVYTGRCEAGALAAMPDHLLGASAAHGVDELHALSARVMVASVTVQNVCDYFALAHAHGNQDLQDVCAELASAELQAVTQSEGFKRHLAEHSAVGMSLMARMGDIGSPEAKGRKRKREQEAAGMAVRPLFTEAGARVTLSAGNTVATKTRGSSGNWAKSVAVLGGSLMTGVHCWEVQMRAGGSSTLPIMVGVCKAGVSMANAAGLYLGSDAWCMYARNGSLWGNGKSPARVAPSSTSSSDDSDYSSDSDAFDGAFAQGDRLGCRLDLSAGTLSFFKNGAPHGRGHTGIVGPVKRFVELSKTNATVTVCECVSFQS